MKSTTLASLVAAVVTLGFVGSAAATVMSADPIFYTLNTNVAGAPDATGTNYGTVSLQDVGDAVNFTISLNSPYVFANTGAKPTTAFAFNVGSGFTINLPTSPIYIAVQPTSTITQNPYGNFTAGIEFQSNAATGVSGGYKDPISFSVTKTGGGDVSYADFQSLSTSSSGKGSFTGYIFSADIGNSLTGLTGNVVASGGIDGRTTPNGVPTSVPEPAPIALLGLGLLGFAAARRKSAK